MTDDPSKTGLDRQLISLNTAHEVRSWTESLKCTEEELRDAVLTVGHSAQKVREYLDIVSKVKIADRWVGTETGRVEAAPPQGG